MDEVKCLELQREVERFIMLLRKHPELREEVWALLTDSK